MFKQTIKKAVVAMKITCLAVSDHQLICSTGPTSTQITEKLICEGDVVVLSKGTYFGLENSGKNEAEFECQVPK